MCDLISLPKALFGWYCLSGTIFFFGKGYIGVEFFFLVTGFLMAKSVCKKENEFILPTDLGRETVLFVWKKVKAILPYHFAAYGLIFIITAIYKKQSVGQVAERIFGSLPGLFLFDKTGFNFGYYNRVEWYITCMIFALMILYPICRKYYSMYVCVIAPVGGMFLLGYLMQNYGTLVGGGVSNWNGFCFVSVLRALAEISLGATCYEISRLISGMTLSKGKKIMLTVLENICFLFVCIFAVSTLDSKYEIYAVIALGITISLTFTGVTYGSDVFDNKLNYFLGESSLMLYLSQVLPLDMVKALFADCSGYTKTILMVLFTIVNAMACKVIGDLFLRIMVKLKKI